MALRRCVGVWFVICVLATSASAGWRELRPLYGGRLDLIAVDAGRAVWSAGPGGLFKSIDGGQSWVLATGNLPTTAIAAIAPDPVQVGTVYAGTDKGLFRTVDGGTTWTRLPLDLPGGVDIIAVAIAPTDTTRIFVATWGSYVWRSLDGGATWQQRASGLAGGWGGPSFIPAIAVDPTNANRVYTSTWRGYLYRSDDAATTWTRISDANTWANGQIHVSRSHPNVLWTTHDEYWFGRGTVLKSTDYGNTWTNMGRPVAFTWTGTDIGLLDVHPTDPNVAYVTTSKGVSRTSGGGTWTQIYTPPLSGQSSMTTVAVDPADASTIFAASYYNGFYRTNDGGSTWHAGNSGLASTSFSALDVCRDVPTTLYLGAQSFGYQKSTDGGFTWSMIGTAQALQTHSLAGLAVHPQNPNLVIANTSDGSTTRIWRSTDGGATFAATSTGYGSSWFRFNPLAPSNVHASVADWQGGFIMSGDAGSTWAVPYSWYIYPGNYDFHPALANVVFSVGNRYTGAPITALHVLWSNTSGSSWTGTGTLGAGMFVDLALDKSDPSTLYVAGKMGSEGTQGVYKFNVVYSGSNVSSITRIGTVFNSGLGNTNVRRLLYDAAKGYLYASTPNGVYRTSDKALTWTAINDGLPNPSTDLLAATPDGDRLFVATSGGLWEYGDALPVPVAVPGISTDSGLLKTVVAATSDMVHVTGTTTTAADTIELANDRLWPNMSFIWTAGNPATGTLTFTPGGNQIGHTFAVTFTATSTLDSTKSASITRYFSVVGDGATDAAAIISAGTDGSVNTPDHRFALDIPAGAIDSSLPVAVNVRYQSNYRRADVYAEGPGGKSGKVQTLSAYDITIGDAPHYQFLYPVALTFAYDPGDDPATLVVMAWDDLAGHFVQRTDTSCLAGFGRVPVTGSIATGGTISVCTTTVSLWAVADMSTFVSNLPPVANAGPNQTHEAVAGGNEVTLDGTGSSDPDGDALTYTWSGPFGTASGAQPTVTLGLGVHEITLTIDDGNGHTASDTVVISIVDTTPPSIAITSPADGSTFLLHQSAVASWACTDSGSGIDVCTGTIANDAALDTATPGMKTLTVEARDAAGNIATLSSTYFVRYAFSGFFAPVVSPPAMNVVNAGRTVPLKWRLTDAAGVPMTNVLTVQSMASAAVACDATPQPFLGEPLVAAGNSVLRYDVTASQFVFDWQTSKAWSGCRAVQLTLDDGAQYWLLFAFK